MFNLDEFINYYVTKRSHSMFLEDIESNKKSLWQGIENKSVLVIGGAGSIGSSFIKAILPFHPSELYVVDYNENALTELTRDLRSSGSFMPAVYLSYPVDYRSSIFEKMFRNHSRNGGKKGFDLVANFSAYKHVRSEKDIYSVEALLCNNVINAKGLLDLLQEFPLDAYFCVSTDKAANPVNIMGASKRIMEDLIFSYSDVFPVKTARFANVAFSNGSLPAGFLERINKLQPLSGPYDVRRYFVSPAESGQICMLAAITGQNREIFFPKLEEAQMMTFDRIAYSLLKARGFKPIECGSDEEAVILAEKLRKNEESKAYPVHFSISDTSGEKEVEEFFTDNEVIDNDRFKSLGVITDKPIPDKKAIGDLIGTLDDAFKNPLISKKDIVKIVSYYLPSFEHIERGKSLDEKM